MNLLEQTCPLSFPIRLPHFECFAQAVKLQAIGFEHALQLLPDIRFVSDDVLKPGNFNTVFFCSEDLCGGLHEVHFGVTKSRFQLHAFCPFPVVFLLYKTTCSINAVDLIG